MGEKLSGNLLTSGLGKSPWPDLRDAAGTE